MKFKRANIFTGDICVFDSFVKDELGIKIRGKIEYNGEKEIFVKVNKFLVPIKEIEGLLQYMVIKNLTKNKNLDFEKLPKQYKKIIIPDYFEYSLEDLVKIFTLNDYKYVSNLKPLFYNINGKVSIEELQDLRIKHKYSRQGITDEERLYL